MGLFSRLIREIRKNSSRDLIRKIRFYLFGRGTMLWALDQDDWRRKKSRAREFFARYPSGSGQDRPNIVFVVPGTWIAGGIAVIVRHANLLRERGYRVTLVTQDLKESFPWYEGQAVPVVPIDRIWGLLESGIDILIATGWNSAPTVDLLPAKRKVYFVQLDERRFYADDRNLQSLVAETYRLPFEYIVMACWMQDWLQGEFGHDPAYVPNGLDLSVFHPSAPLVPRGDRLRVLIEGPISIPFKGVAEAYAIASEFDCEIWMVSSNGVPPKEWKVDRFCEKVSLQDMPRWYSSCDILLKMSRVESFSYPPLEMMACGGVPIMLRVSGIEEYAVHEENCLIGDTIDDVRKALDQALKDANLRDRLSKNGIETAKRWTWDRSVEALEHALQLNPHHDGR